MNKFKICMLGAFAVGKTSLVQQYVNSIFSEKYQTTLGVKIDKKSLEINGSHLNLILWDLAGEDEFINVRSAYLRGSSGAMLVADGTRAETLDITLQLKSKLEAEVGDVPVILIVNKLDLKAEWNIDQAKLNRLREEGIQVIETSAKSSDNVKMAFTQMGERLLAVIA